MLVTVNPSAGEYYNIGGDKVLEISEILIFLISISSIKSSFKIEVEKSRLRPIDADLQVPNVDKFKKHTG